ncbi:MAG: rhodanese-like domain-containing protein [Bacteroidales bacterium]|nr:rhodanese-like domain-containing protein [Bacteroidales bacterium]
MIKVKLYKWVSALFIIILFSACSNIYENGKELAADTKPYIEEITVDELNLKIENQEEFLLLDVRQPAEYQKSNIPGSILMPRGTVEFKISDDAFWEEEFLYTPLKEDVIIIYCKKGDRGILATKALTELGFTNVKNLSGGISAWDPEFNSGNAEAPASGGCGG